LVAISPEGKFNYPVGRAGLEEQKDLVGWEKEQKRKTSDIISSNSMPRDEREDVKILE
jgi:hypothetical protein